MKGRFLAVDWGDRRIGLAVSDPSGTIASPAGFIARRAGKRPPIAELLRRAEEVGGVEGFVVGLPLDGNGDDTPRALEARHVADELTKRTGLPARLVDERFTTAAALRAIREMGGTTRGRKGERMLQEKGRGERIDVTFTAAGGAAHLADRAEGGGSGVPLVDEHGAKAGSLLELGGDRPRFEGARCVLAGVVERQAHHEAARLERLGASDDLGHRRPLARPTFDVPGRRGDHAERVADGPTHAAIAVVDGQQAALHPSAIEAKNSRLVFVRAMR